MNRPGVSGDPDIPGGATFRDGETGLSGVSRDASLLPVTEVQTPRLCLHAIDTAEGERIVGRRTGTGDDWARTSLSTVTLSASRPFSQLRPPTGTNAPGHYRITRTADGKAIGGIGFKGQPDDGCVEVGYGLTPSARGHGYAAEALVALLNVATDHGCPELSPTPPWTTPLPSGPSNVPGSAK